MFDCYICNKSAQFDGVILIRQNKFGVKGIWACEEHSTVKLKPEVDELVHDIQDSMIELNIENNS
jgi:hypothetical protein